MSIRVQDVGELAYGGLVTAMEWWDEKRVGEGQITDKDIMKKFSTYAYLVPGVASTAMSAFGIWRRSEPWLEHLSHGFIYDFPRFIKNVVNAMQETPTAKSRSESAAVKEAQKILERAKQITQGRGAERSYQREFEYVAPHAF